MTIAKIEFDKIDKRYNLILSCIGDSTTSYPLTEELYDKLNDLFKENKPDFSIEYKRPKR